MTICQSTLCSLVVAAGLVAGAIDTADNGPVAVQVITVDTHGNTRVYLAALKPLMDLMHEYAPRAEIEVLERTDGGDPTGNLYILVHHPDLMHLEDANDRTVASGEWASALKTLESTGRTLKTSEILLDRTPD